MENNAFLPEAIIINILSFLPAISLVPYKQVCKAWRNLLEETHFINLHIARQLSLLFHDHDGQLYNKVSFAFFNSASVPKSIYFAECSNRRYFSSRKLITIKNAVTSTINRVHFSYGNCEDYYSLVGSCNGLICLAFTTIDSNCGGFITGEPVYVCNPVTRETVPLPRLFFDIAPGVSLSVQSGFGYLPSTNEYKVVRTIHLYGSLFREVEVYTLGGEGSNCGWRKKGNIDYVVDPTQTAVFVDGALYWKYKSTILAFSLADEEFWFIPLPPPCFQDGRDFCCHLVSLGGCLCVVHQKYSEDVTDIWSLKKNSASGLIQQEDWCSRWSKQYSIAYKIHGESSLKIECHPIAVTKSGRVLILYNNDLLLHNPKTGAMKKIQHSKQSNGSRLYQPIIHMNSFVSLKGIMKKA